MLRELGTLLLWSTLLVSGLVDFASTLSLCIIIIGIERACKCVLAEPECLSPLLTLQFPGTLDR
jgi:hypothetical protein